MIRKNKNSYYLAIITLIVALSASSCNDYFIDPVIRGCGNLTTETREISDINSVNLRVPAEVIIRQAEKASLLIEADRNLMPILADDVAGKTLYLQSRKNIRLSKNKITVYIDIPDLENLKILGSGNIYVEDVFQTDRISLTIQGSGNISIGLDTELLESTIKGSGDLHLDGFSEKHMVEVMGSGNIYASNLENDICKISVMGSGNSHVKVYNSLEVSIKGSGNVYYSGSPNVYSIVNGTGKIIKASK